MPTTILDVARRAGVSATTVSHVLNRTRYVSPELTNRVRRAVEKLHFRPSFLARSLRAGRTQSVGLVVSDVLNPFFTQVARVIEDELRSAGYSLIISSTDEQLTTERAYLQVLVDKQVDGIILAPTAGDHRFLATLVRRVPLVLINRSVQGGPHLPSVTADNRGGARQAVEHLLAHGHTRVAMVVGLRGLSTSRDRMAGYSDALRSAGIAADPALVVEGGGGKDSIEHKILDVLRLRQQPTAIFVGSMSMIVPVLQALRKSGRTCPKEVALVAFTDYLWCEVTAPPLTCVRQPVREMGEAAADLFLRAVRDPLSAPPPAIVLPTTLAIRESCGCPGPIRDPGEAPLVAQRRKA
jgi:LacI family transcriptional regulator